MNEIHEIYWNIQINMAGPFAAACLLIRSNKICSSCKPKPNADWASFQWSSPSSRLDTSWYCTHSIAWLNHFKIIIRSSKRLMLPLVNCRVIVVACNSNDKFLATGGKKLVFVRRGQLSLLEETSRSNFCLFALCCWFAPGSHWRASRIHKKWHNLHAWYTRFSLSYLKPTS